MIIGGFLKSLISFPSVLDMLVVEVKTSEFITIMQKYSCTILKKVLMFYISGVIIVCFFLYYLSLFCIIYKSSQVSWFTGCVYSFFLSMLTNIGICLGLTILRKVALYYKSQYIFNIEIYIKCMV